MALQVLYIVSTLASLALGLPAPESGDLVQAVALKRQEMASDHPIQGVKRVKIRSGPYNVPNMMTPSFPTGVHGMIWNKPDRKIDKPCEEHCTILRQWAGLEYPNGTNANIDTGMWLHHMVHFTAGPTRWDPVCYNKISLPFGPVKLKPDGAERYFTSGNERTVFDFCPGCTDLSKPGTGYYLTPEDKFSYLVDLMNMNMENKQVYMTMTYDYIDGQLPAGWNAVKTVWLDLVSCGTSEKAAPQQTGSYSVESDPWRPNFEGKIIDSIGHLHDGGASVLTKLKSDEIMCQSNTTYAESKEYIFTGTRTGPDKPAIKHISSMTPCSRNIRNGKTIKEQYLQKSQSLSVVGHYDYDRYEGNLEKGKQGEIMAITMIPVAIPKEGIPKPGKSGFPSLPSFSGIFGLKYVGKALYDLGSEMN